MSPVVLVADWLVAVLLVTTGLMMMVAWALATLLADSRRQVAALRARLAEHPRRRREPPAATAAPAWARPTLALPPAPQDRGPTTGDLVARAALCGDLGWPDPPHVVDAESRTGPIRIRVESGPPDPRYRAFWPGTTNTHTPFSYGVNR